MSISYSIVFIFDKKELRNLDKILSWICREDKFDFSKGIPQDSLGVSFVFKKTDDLVKDMLTIGGWTKKELDACKSGHTSLGLFYLGISEPKIREKHKHSYNGDLYSVYEDKLILKFRAAASGLGELAMRNKTIREFLIDFCKRFNPKEGFFTMGGENVGLFWPKNEVLFGEEWLKAQKQFKVRNKEAMARLALSFTAGVYIFAVLNMLFEVRTFYSIIIAFVAFVSLNTIFDLVSEKLRNKKAKKNEKRLKEKNI